MSINHIFFGHLVSDSAVTDLVGTSPARIHPGVSPEGTIEPRITYQVISSIPYNLLKGGHKGTKYRIQVNAWGTTREKADDLGIKARLALEVGGYVIDGDQDKDPETEVYYDRFDWSTIEP